MTPKQKRLFDFIKHYLKTNDGISPSFYEMQKGIGLRSKSGVHRLVKGLEERGHITLLPHRARAIQLVEIDKCALQEELEGMYNFLEANGMTDRYESWKALA